MIKQCGQTILIFSEAVCPNMVFQHLHCNQGTVQWPLIHPSTHTFMHQWVAAAMSGTASSIGSNLELSSSPNEPTTDGDGVDFGQPTFQALENLLNLLSYSHPI